MIPIRRLSFNVLRNPSLNLTTATATAAAAAGGASRYSAKTGDDEWNDAWETAWLPDDLSGKSRAPWEADVNFSLPRDNPTDPANSQTVLPDMDSETKAFVEDMNENWDQRKGKSKASNKTDGALMKGGNEGGVSSSSAIYNLESIKTDYRVKKQRVHSGLWVKEIEKMEEARLGDQFSGAGDDIEKLLDSCSEIFDSHNDDLNNTKIPGTEFKNKPDGWESTSRTQDGNIWEMSQREEDILLQEFERRIAFNKFQIASFVKQHIFSRRRPIDGWKYMIEVIGPNSKRGKGSVSRLPTVSDEATQPFKEEKIQFTSSSRSYKGR
ncbi:OLC1v1032819C1 [Oldenlandia corymbosa var. corymbosa]|uniref:OLC1v1032819C1 n=1 Tax=Oldenlandia corymbosa var. corymbosa TaxID=529605 RepID=A0AAV1CPU2_OLDCO|nr:OLC1v1032819C1 [Oldenlandia corymbosa var. corymbosa]